MANYVSSSSIPTTAVLDVSDVYSTEVTSPEFKELIVRLYQNFNMMLLAINDKDTGIYDTDEFITGQSFFSNPNLNSTTSSIATEREVYRKVINFESLPNATTKSTAHGITIDANVTFTRIYGASSNAAGTSFIPLPHSSTTLNKNVELIVTNTNVSVITGIDMSAYTRTYIVLEYIRT